ncbi:metallophosphoesterase [Billgrantia ethanolica]|uniref:Phosphodiesterase n=1 Tax=Billgrantia ethanolica TaxID=2733486 RepID=A0ABS9A5J7_9GAMM|nr:metallophosphoesterase [Halomonas ethanolica]MCE8004099.1 phosphodiesterase [Halomonas ethanolica]
MHKVLWLTDPHLVEPDNAASQAPAEAWQRFRRCLDDIRHDHADAELLVLSGDLVQLNNPGAYALLREALETLHMPYRLLVGNHDDRTALHEAFPHIPMVRGFLQGSDDIGETRLIYLDTQAAQGHYGELCPFRLDWLAAELEAASTRPAAIFLHHPPMAIGVPALDRLKLLESEGLRDLLQSRRAPTQFFCGHVHRNVSGRWCGHPFATLKSTNTQFAFDMQAERLRRCDEEPGYGVLLFDNGEVIVNYVDISTDH